MYYHATPCQRLHDYDYTHAPSHCNNNVIKFKVLSRLKKFFYKIIYKTSRNFHLT